MKKGVKTGAMTALIAVVLIPIFIAHLVHGYLEEILRRKQVMNVFKQYVAPQVVDKITGALQRCRKVFGIQEVKEGETAMQPKLNPAASGAWDFDFSTPIESDTVISWK